MLAKLKKKLYGFSREGKAHKNREIREAVRGALLSAPGDRS